MTRDSEVMSDPLFRRQRQVDANCIPDRRHTNIMPVAIGVMVRKRFVGIRWHLIAIAIEVGKKRDAGAMVRSGHLTRMRSRSQPQRGCEEQSEHDGKQPSHRSNA